MARFSRTIGKGLSMESMANERLIPFQAARSEFPGRKRVGLATLHRWCSHGIKGVKLETIFVGGQRFTSREAIQRFVDGQNQFQTTGSNRQGSRQLLYYVHITDFGSHTDLEIGNNGEITVTDDGGCKTEGLGDCIDVSLSHQEIADEILQRWLVGYDGGEDGAAENQLMVTVRDDEMCWLAVARAGR
jgi:hypothetical protein